MSPPVTASLRKPTRRAGSSARKRPCTCRRSRLSTRRTARPPACASRLPRTARRSASRRGPGRRSMPDAQKDKAYTPRLKQDYDDRIVKAMTEKFSYKNRLDAPKLEKIVINMGLGEANQHKQDAEAAAT